MGLESVKAMAAGSSFVHRACLWNSLYSSYASVPVILTWTIDALAVVQLSADFGLNGWLSG